MAQTEFHARGLGRGGNVARVGDRPADVRHHHAGEPVGGIPLQVEEWQLPHHPAANPTACGQAGPES